MSVKSKLKKERLFCPYCDNELVSADFPYCDTCQVTIFYCPKCKKAVPRDKKVCPNCGASIRADS